MNPIGVLLLVICIIAAKFVCKSTKGHFFQEQKMSGSAAMRDVTTASLFQESFHSCSLKCECNYVIKDIRTGEFSIREKEEDLPTDMQYFRIWKKMKPGKHYNAKCITKDVASMFLIAIAPPP